MTPLGWWMIGIGFAIFFIGATIIVVWLTSKRVWNYSYTVLEYITGQGWSISRRGKCKLVSFGDGGEEIFFLKKLKKYRSAYGKRIGKNAILWVIGQDGYWYNASFDDFDQRLLRMGVFPVDTDARYANASVRKGINARYDKTSWIEKYGVYIAFGLVLLTIIAFFVFSNNIFNKSNEYAKTNAEITKTLSETLTEVKGILSSVDNIKSGGSGYIVTNSTV